MGLIPENIGRKIAEYRRSNDWTQEECAVRLGLTVRRLRRFESGTNATIQTLERIAKGLGVEVIDLLSPPMSSALPCGDGQQSGCSRSTSMSRRRSTESRTCRIRSSVRRRKPRRSDADGRIEKDETRTATALHRHAMGNALVMMIVSEEELALNGLRVRDRRTGESTPVEHSLRDGYEGDAGEEPGRQLDAQRACEGSLAAP